MSLKAKKKVIFVNGVKALRNLSNRFCDQYICPLCLKEFTNLDLENGLLTLEHAPPRSIGGRGIVLTCADCNNKPGTKLDSQLIARMDFNKSMSYFANNLDLNLKRTRAKFTIGNHEINVDLVKEKNSTNIVFLRKENNPNKLTQAEDYIKRLIKSNAWSGTEFNIAPKNTYHKWKSQLAILKSAYLLAFAKFGYKYIFQKDFDAIRQQILDPNLKLEKNFWLNGNYKKDPILLHAKFPFECILVNIEGHIVMLPGFSESGNCYVELRKKFVPGQNLNFTGDIYTFPKKFEAIWDGA